MKLHTATFLFYLSAFLSFVSVTTAAAAAASTENDTTISSNSNLRGSGATGGQQQQLLQQEQEQEQHRELVVATPLSQLKDRDQFHLYSSKYSKYVQVKNDKNYDYFSLFGTDNHASWETFEFRKVSGEGTDTQWKLYNVGQRRYVYQFNDSWPRAGTWSGNDGDTWVLSESGVGAKICIKNLNNRYLRMNHWVNFFVVHNYDVELQGHCLDEEHFILVRP